MGVTHTYLGPIWYHSKPLDILYFPNQFLDWDFFCHFLQQDSSNFLLLTLIIQGPILDWSGQSKFLVSLDKIVKK